MKTNLDYQSASLRPAAYHNSGSGVSAQPQPLQLSVDEDDTTNQNVPGSLNLGNWSDRLSLNGPGNSSLFPPTFDPSMLNSPQTPVNLNNPGPAPVNAGLGDFIRPSGEGSTFNLRVGNDENHISGSRNFENGNTTLGARLLNRLNLGLGFNNQGQPNNFSMGVQGDRFSVGGNVNPTSGQLGLNFGVNRIPNFGDLQSTGNYNPTDNSFGVGARVNNIFGSNFNVGANYSHDANDRRLMFSVGGRF